MGMAPIARLTAAPASPSRRLNAAANWERRNCVMLSPFVLAVETPLHAQGFGALTARTRESRSAPQ